MRGSSASIMPVLGRVKGSVRPVDMRFARFDRDCLENNAIESTWPVSITVTVPMHVSIHA